MRTDALILMEEFHTNSLKASLEPIWTPTVCFAVSLSLAYCASETQVFNCPVRLLFLLPDCHHPSLLVICDDLNLRAGILAMGYQHCSITQL